MFHWNSLQNPKVFYLSQKRYAYTSFKFLFHMTTSASPSPGTI